jgi:hypothetical protein
VKLLKRGFLSSCFPSEYEDDAGCAQPNSDSVSKTMIRLPDAPKPVPSGDAVIPSAMNEESGRSNYGSEEGNIAAGPLTRGGSGSE